VSWRRLNAFAAAAWMALIVPSVLLGWVNSVVFVAAISIYANVAAHLAAWRADS
jgi:hypothetical protein